MSEVDERMMQDDDMVTEAEENQETNSTQQLSAEKQTAKTEPDLDLFLENFNYLLDIQKKYIKNLADASEKLPDDITKLENVCAQATIIYNNMPLDIQKQAAKLYQENLKQAQTNCNEFSRQLQAWLKEREEGRDKALIKATRMPLYGVVILSLTQMILFIWLLWYMNR